MCEYYPFFYVRQFFLDVVVSVIVLTITYDFKYTNTYNANYYLQICCHIAQNNEIFIVFTHYFNKEKYVLLEDDMQYATETCRSILSVLV